MKLIWTMLLFVSACTITDAQQFTWGKTYGGASADNIQRIALDSNGNVFAAGTFTGPLQSILGTIPSYGFQDVFLTKYNSDGTLLWQISIGGPNTDQISSISCDTADNIWVAGRFQTSIDLDPSDSTEIITSDPSGALEGFLAKYDGQTGVLIEYRNITSGGTIDIRCIRINEFNEIFIAGQYTQTVDFDFGGGTFSKTSNVFSGDCFIGKYYGDFQLIWMNVIGSQTPAIDFISDFCLGADGYVYSTGLIGGTADINPGAGTTNLVAATDAFLIRYSQNDGTLSWGFLLGGSSLELGNAVAMTENGQVIITGNINSTSMDVDPGAAAVMLTKTGTNAAPFLARYTSSAVLVSAVIMQGSQTLTASVSRLYTGPNNTMIATGNYKGDVDLELGAAVYTVSSGDSTNAFILRFEDDWSLMNYFEQGGNGDQLGNDIVLKGTLVYQSGQVSNTTFPEYPSQTISIPRVGSGLDGFLFKYNLVPDALSINSKESIQLSVFPNPANSQVYVRNSTLENTQIIDQFGRKINLEINQSVIDLKELTPGIYIVLQQTKSGFKSARLIKY